MRHGCMERLNRKRGPEVWQFRWSEFNPSGKRLYHKKIVGTVEQYPDETAVRRAVVGLLSEINTDVRPTNPRAITIAQLCDHFEQRELSKENTWRSHATKKDFCSRHCSFPERVAQTKGLEGNKAPISQTATKLRG
jgi:integrase